MRVTTAYCSEWGNWLGIGYQDKVQELNYTLVTEELKYDDSSEQHYMLCRWAESLTPECLVFTIPLCSAVTAAEKEEIALNIMRLMHQTGNIWRTVSLKEYEYKYGELSPLYRTYFDEVLPHCSSAEAASKFSYKWEAMLKKIIGLGNSFALST